MGRVGRQLRGLIQQVRRRRPDWHGIYDRFEDVPVRGSGFDSEAWITATRDQTVAAIEAATRRPEGALPVIPVEHELLAMLTAAMSREQSSVRVLDFGGGMGSAYVAVSSTLVGPQLHYDIVESPGVCTAGESLFSSAADIRFRRELPDETYAPDIVYVCSALQYVRDYGVLLERLLAYGPRFVLLRSLSAGTNPTYATEQTTVPGSSIPYWFINRDEIVSLCAAAGFTLIFAVDDSREYDQRGFPPAYRLGRTCTLLFTR